MDRRVTHIGIGILIVLGLTLAVMLLWNALMPEIAGLGSIGFLQALGLLILCRVLFGGLGHGGLLGMARARHSLHERLRNMSPEEREAFVRERHPRLFRHMRRGGREHGDCRRDHAERPEHGDCRRAHPERSDDRQQPERETPGHGMPE